MIVYKATNIVTGKSYIGITQYTLEHRRKTHEGNRNQRDYIFYKSMRKHGTDVWEWEVIDTADTWKELNQLEKKYIKEFNTLSPNGYNLTEGGDGGKGQVWTEEMRKQQSERLMGHQHTEETKQKMSRTRKGKNLSWINPDYSHIDYEEVIQYIKDNPKELPKDISKRFGFTYDYYYRHFKKYKIEVCEQDIYEYVKLNPDTSRKEIEEYFEISTTKFHKLTGGIKKIKERI